MIDYQKISNYTISELIDYIITDFHQPLREKLLKIRKYGIEIKKSNGNTNQNLNLLLELFNQFEQEFINHINKEETDFFPEIIKLEKGEKISKKKLKTFLRLQESEHNEIENYLIGGENVIKDLGIKNNSNYIELQKVVKELYSETLEHISVENDFLNTKVIQLTIDN